ncbi:MAG: ATP-binding response regulator, partial [Solirubrobacteraceae bacterium]
MTPSRVLAHLPADLRRAVALGGELGERFAAFDWASHPLGPPHDWPPETRSLVTMALTSRFPTVLWLGQDLSLVYNDGYVPMLGKKHPAALGRAGRDVWPEIWDVIGPMLDGVLRTGTATWSDDLLLELASAGRPQERYFTFTYSPMFLADGAVSGIFCAVNETTERVLGERRLRALNALAAELVDSHSPQEVAAATIRACEDHREDLPFTAVYLPEEIGGPASLRAATSNVRDALEVHASDASFWDGAALGAADVRGIVDVAQRLPEPPSAPQGGSPRRAVVLGLAGPTAGSEAGVVVVGLNPLRPLDEQYEGFCRLLGDQVSAALASARAYEGERHRAEALEELDRAKTTFLTNVSHEFRTPLTLMLGPLEDAIADPQAAPELLAQLRLAHRSGRRLLRLVNALLDFARLEAGEATVRPQVVDLGALTAQIASSFAGVCERARIGLVLDCEPVHALVDVSMWETIVLNLISNAFKHTFRGAITVSVTSAPDGTLSVRIADTGVGIEAGDLERLFERFYRPQRARGRSVEGSGIGLALVRNLVELHEGSIEIDSEAGAGTAVSVALPAPALSAAATASAPVSELPAAEVFVDEAQLWLQAEPAGPPAASAPAPRPLILIVDDNADMRDHLNRILGSRWATLLARDGLTALQLIREQRPDLVVTDVMMPALDGLGLVATIRGDPRLARLPVIMLSARAGPEASGEGFAAGADDYVVKPFRSAELVNRVSARLQAAARSRSAERRRRSAGHGSAVAQLSGALTAARSVPEAVDAIVRAVMSAGLDPDTIEIALRDEDPRLVRIRSVIEPGAARSDHVELAAADSPRAICETIRTGLPSVAGGSGETEGHTVIVHPLKPPGGATFGALALRFPIPHPPAQGEHQLVESIAKTAGQALERVVVGEREHRIATALQDRLLDIQPCAGAAIAAAYRP